jgi:photosystem II stability/assembly factor-like uncharacterized protein
MKAAILCICVALTAGACKKSGGGGGGGGGGGTGWLVGTNGMMLNVQTDGSTAGYNTATQASLNGIACRGGDEAWVVGNQGTLLHTTDAGATWQPQTVPTSADLRALATQDTGPVFVGGKGVFLTSADAGVTWTALGDGTANFRSIAAAQEAETVLAVAEDGSLWSYEAGQLIKRGSFAGARAVAVTPDGQTAILVGNNLISRSTDGGRSWSPVSASDALYSYDDVRVNDDGEALAVGTGGAVAHIPTTGAATVQLLGTADLHTIHLAEPDEHANSVGYTAGEGGQVWITKDGGSTWAKGPNAGQAVLGVDEIGAGHR